MKKVTPYIYYLLMNNIIRFILLQWYITVQNRKIIKKSLGLHIENRGIILLFIVFIDRLDLVL